MIRVAALVVALGLVSGCTASAGATPPATRDVPVTITGLRFVPDHFAVRVGETIRFAVTNPTSVPHELYIGSMPDQLAHEREVMAARGATQLRLMDASGYGIYLQPYDSGQFVYTFSAPGEMYIGCHVPGHWTGGMVASITISRP